VTPFLYKLVRHPLYLGFILAFWGGPDMSAGHLLFAASMSAYILIAIRFEERDLVRQLGERYVAYRERVPMLVPGTSPRGGAKSDASELT
ncbi:MAG TPA: isoprenylcysteine carboxylmethyltransferase family protein, partial [Pseudoxanthomonas sp.]|nr:isoprenylcysteine carboxylmethyltransferase family protein [Pseudoxanthomonas sp.]